LCIPNKFKTCYSAVALHCLASVHDPSVMGVVLPSSSLSIGTVQNIVAEISVGGSLGPNKMKRLLSLVEGKDYKQGQQGDTVEFLRKMATFDIGLTESCGDASHDINEAVILEMHVKGGIRTNASALEALRQRCIGAGLQYPHLEACGLANLRAGLRTRAQGAPTGVYQPPSLEAELGVPLPLPVPQAGPSGSGGMVSASVPALGPVPAPAAPPQKRKRASPGTQTKEERRRLNTLNKRLERDRKRNLAADED
jgi:hypothetical protein